MIYRDGYYVEHIRNDLFSKFYFCRDPDVDQSFFVEWFRAADSWALENRSSEDVWKFAATFFPNSVCRRFMGNYVLDMDDRDKVWFRLAFE